MIPLRDANPTARRPVVTVGLIGICIAVFALELWVQASGGERAFGRLIRDYGLVPGSLTGQLGPDAVDSPYGAASTLITSMFLHSDPLHIGFNLLFLWIFGNNIEDRMGHLPFLAFYLVGGLVAAGVQVAADPASPVPVIGASGAIAAVLGAYLVLYPGARVLSLIYFGLFFQLIHIPAVVLLGLWFVVQVGGAVMANGGSASAGGVALFAHIGGFVAGLTVGALLRVAGSGRGPRPLRPTDGIGVG